MTNTEWTRVRRTENWDRTYDREYTAEVRLLSGLDVGDARVYRAIVRKNNCVIGTRKLADTARSMREWCDLVVEEYSRKGGGSIDIGYRHLLTEKDIRERRAVKEVEARLREGANGTESDVYEIFLMSLPDDCAEMKQLPRMFDDLPEHVRFAFTNALRWATARSASNARRTVRPNFRR